MDDRRPSLRRVDQEGLLKVRRDSKARRPSLSEVIPDWPALQKVKRPEKVKITFLCNQHQKPTKIIYRHIYIYYPLHDPLPSNFVLLVGLIMHGHEKESFFEPLQDIRCKEEDKEVTFSCSFCKPSTRLRWLKNKVEIFHGLKYHFDSVGAKQKLTIYKLHPDDSGKYFCRVNDIETSAWLEVIREYFYT
ncbi:unnamed protein product [Rotaria magnacalcarata]|uniref:Ig-like domain-containing protein n=2 Tax=Rotaria magnacalcarata TaxID=392030 RepID=A0A8S3FM69_9BILA|nr:unnamed protein product [Rotaria magnacalcarata]CAF5206360.1 unnamed protein product [Rotaria magnacalcarata]